MADPTATTQLGTMVAGAVGTAIAAKESAFANSLLQANFEQLISGQFHIQLGDIVSIIGVTLLIWGSVRELRREIHAKNHKKSGQRDS